MAPCQWGRKRTTHRSGGLLDGWVLLQSESPARWQEAKANSTNSTPSPEWGPSGKGFLLQCLSMSPKSWYEDLRLYVGTIEWNPQSWNQLTWPCQPWARVADQEARKVSCFRSSWARHPREPQKGILQGWSTTANQEGMVSQGSAEDPHENGPVISILKWRVSAHRNLKPQASSALPADPLYPRFCAKPFMLNPIQSSYHPPWYWGNKLRVDKQSAQGHVSTEPQYWNILGGLVTQNPYSYQPPHSLAKPVSLCAWNSMAGRGEEGAWGRVETVLSHHPDSFPLISI